MQLIWSSGILGKIFLIKSADYVGGFLNWLSFFDHITSRKQPVMFIPKIEVREHSTFVSYAHFTSSQQLENSDRETINQIVSLTDQFIISTNKPELIDHLEVERVAIQGRNRGFDLAMHRDVLVALKKSSTWPQYLILTNNSLIWKSPNGFKEQFQECVRLSNDSGANIIFMTDSLQPRYHLQSYFIFVNTSGAEAQKLIYRTFSKCRNWRVKRTAVFFGEKRLITRLSTSTEAKVMFPILTLLTIFLKTNSISPEKIYQIASIINPNQHLVKEMLDLGAQFKKKPRGNKKLELLRKYLIG